MKTAVSQFETDNNVKLYSLSGMPIFFLVFKDLSEALALEAGAVGVAAVAGGTIGAGTATAGGTVGGSASAAGGSLGGSAVTAGGAVGGNAAAAGGTAISGSGAAAGAAGEAAAAAGTTGGTGASGAVTGFLGTVAGKAAITAAVAVVGAAAAVAVTQSSSVESNVVKQEYVEPHITDDMVCIYEELEVEPGSNYTGRYKETYYDTDGNVVLFVVYGTAAIEEFRLYEFEISKNTYYADGTPWKEIESGNFVYKDYPQFGWYGVETYTQDVVSYYPDGTIHSITSYEYAQGHEMRRTYYNEDGSIRSYADFEYAEVASDRWERVKGTRYNTDGSVRAYNTFEYDEKGELMRDNFYNADGELQYYHIWVRDETGTREEGFDADGTPLN